MFIYIHILSYYTVPLLYFVSKCNVGYSLMFLHSYYKLFLYFTLCLSVVLDTLSCSFTSIFFLTTSMSKCNVGYSLMFIYIHILSYYKLFLYFTLCLSIMLDTLSCSYTSTFFLTTSCSFTLLCV